MLCHGRRMRCVAPSEDIRETLAGADKVVTAEIPFGRIWEDMSASSRMPLGLYCLLRTGAEANRDRAAAKAMEMPSCQQSLSGME